MPAKALSLPFEHWVIIRDEAEAERHELCYCGTGRDHVFMLLDGQIAPSIYEPPDNLPDSEG